MMPSLSPEVIEALKLSICVSIGCVLIVTPPGIVLGWFLARKNFPGKTLLEGIVHVPLVVPPIVVGYLLLIILGNNGYLGRPMAEMFGFRLAFSFFGAVIAATIVSFPLVVRSVRTAVELVDPRLEQAAGTLGAGPIRRWLTITLPLAMPGIIAGMTLAAARSLGEFGATMAFAGNTAGETRTLSLAIYTAMQIPGQERTAHLLVVASVILSLVALCGSGFLTHWMRRRAGALE